MDTQPHRAAPSRTQITPSILSADFGHLIEQIDVVMDAGAEVIHVDVMDGCFVPNITIGPPVVKAIAPHVHARGGSLDVHLMVDQPERYVDVFVAAGADGLTVHQEACVHLHRTLAQIREAGAWAGVSINPGTAVQQLAAVKDDCDLVLVMSVDPGFGGQSFIAGSVEKVAQVRQLMPKGVVVEVDGGIGPQTAAHVVRAGATLLVAGSSVFGDDPARRFRELSALIAD